MGIYKYTPVDLGGTKNRNDVISALEKTAEGFGWRLRTKSDYMERYKLGSVKKSSSLTGTEVYLRGTIFGKATIKVGNGNIDEITLIRGLGWGYAYDETIEDFLCNFSDNLR